MLVAGQEAALAIPIMSGLCPVFGLLFLHTISAPLYKPFVTKNDASVHVIMLTNYCM